MIKIGKSVNDHSGYNSGMLLVFGNAFVVRIAFSMPYLAIIKVMSLAVRCFKPDCVNTVYSKVGMI
jgi:hypothetical protein